MNILSLFDGISVAQLALKKANIKVDNYYASEIDEYAMKITRKNFPNTIFIGDVKNIDTSKYQNVDLLIGGSPCQDFSIANTKRKGLNKDSKSILVNEFARVLQETNPKNFILENVYSMTNEYKEYITKIIGVEPVLFNSSLLSAQNRKRYFWTNIKFELPNDLNICIKDILDSNDEREYIYPKNIKKTKNGIKWDTSGKGHSSQQDRAYSIYGKFPTIPASRTVTKRNIMFEDGSIGLLTWNELERLQGLPDNYTDIGKDNRIEKRGAAIGNSFHADVITHILNHI